MSLRDKHNRSGGRFSSLSLDSYSIPKIRARNLQGSHITAVTFNKNLLTPVRIGIDPTVQDVRTQEKDQLKSLNNRFVSFIDKVRYLEQQNKILETKWKLLEEKKVPSSEVEPLMKSYIAKLQRQLDFLQTGKAHLEAASIAMHKNVEDYKTKYENELSKRDDAEYEFVRIKKEVDASYLCMLEVEKQLAGVGEEFNFFKTLYAQEFLELQNTLKETSVVVKMDNSRGLDMNQIIADVKDQYEDVAARSREEAETWHKNKIDQMSAEADLHGNDLRRTKMEIADINRIIRRLQNQILAVQKQCTSLETQTTEAEQHGERAVKDAKDHIRDLELALQRAKQNMARQIRDFQELMNVKLALDIEISTYRKLLEGEEDRIEQPLTVSIQK